METSKVLEVSMKPKIAKTFVVVIASAVVLILGACSSNSASKPTAASATSGSTDITITKSQITDKATFIPYEAGGVKMEVIAVKAPDGTIRTAFNTCQVCFDSGRGYYVQEGDKLICQNCGNQFKISQIEKQKNGCNPVPILEENKKDDGITITITSSFLGQNTALFANWKTR
jgi:uncharacterized membrane protein